jgi:hypothetical protein
MSYQNLTAQRRQKFNQVVDVIVRWVRPLSVPTADIHWKHMDFF